MSPEPFKIYTVYDHPSDYPDSYVVKRWLLTQSSDEPVQDEGFFVASQDLEMCRNVLIEMNLTPLMRSDMDDPVIIESWF